MGGGGGFGVKGKEEQALWGKGGCVVRAYAPVPAIAQKMEAWWNAGAQGGKSLKCDVEAARSRVVKEMEERRRKQGGPARGRAAGPASLASGFAHPL